MANSPRRGGAKVCSYLTPSNSFLYYRLERFLASGVSMRCGNCIDVIKKVSEKMRVFFLGLWVQLLYLCRSLGRAECHILFVAIGLFHRKI